MKEVTRKENFFDAITIPIKLLLITGILFVVFGFVLVLVSLKTEILDHKYKMSQVTEYTKNENIRLPEGQVFVTKETEYIEKGIYKITYKNHANKSKNGILESNTYLIIKDLLGEGYILNSSIVINDKKYYNSTKATSKDGIILNCENNIIEISIPDSKIITENEIVYYIKLIGRKTDYKYETSKETYFNITPSIDNSYYLKKTSQSYLIEGKGYILLEKSN